MTLRTATTAHLPRAAVEGMLCALADGFGFDALIAHGATVKSGHPGRRRGPVGGGAAHRAGGLRGVRSWHRSLANTSPPAPPARPPGSPPVAHSRRVAPGGAQPPSWAASQVRECGATAAPMIREQYAAVRDLVHDRHSA